MKYKRLSVFHRIQRSPSMRREWIEMISWQFQSAGISQSPSMRREWIEITLTCRCTGVGVVSLHAEGVD